MNLLLIILFVLNVILTLADASIAYHRASRFVAFFNPDPDEREKAADRLKSLLPLLVALYITVNCYAYSLRHPGYLAGLGALLLGDILLQMHISRKGERCM